MIYRAKVRRFHLEEGGVNYDRLPADIPQFDLYATALTRLQFDGI